MKISGGGDESPLDNDDCDDSDEVKTVCSIHDRQMSHYLYTTDGMIPSDSIPHLKCFPMI